MWKKLSVKHLGLDLGECGEEGFERGFLLVIICKTKFSTSSCEITDVLYFSRNVSILSSFQIYYGIAICTTLWLYCILWWSSFYGYKSNLWWVYSIYLFYPTLCVLAFPLCLFSFFLIILARCQSNFQAFSKNEILFLFIFSFVFYLTYFYPYFCYFFTSCYSGFTLLFFKKNVLDLNAKII